MRSKLIVTRLLFTSRQCPSPASHHHYSGITVSNSVVIRDRDSYLMNVMVTSPPNKSDAAGVAITLSIYWPTKQYGAVYLKSNIHCTPLTHHGYQRDLYLPEKDAGTKEASCGISLGHQVNVKGVD
eukprot:scaffold4140_cov178-Ochromonas_danica.AAC.9